MLVSQPGETDDLALLNELCLAEEDGLLVPHFGQVFEDGQVAVFPSQLVLNIDPGILFTRPLLAKNETISARLHLVHGYAGYWCE